MNRIVVGDDIRIIINLTKDGDTFDIDTDAIVEMVLTTDGEIVLGPIAAISTEDDADWTISKIVFIMTSTDTEELTPNTKATIEVQIDDPVNSDGKTTWLNVGEISFAQGYID